MEGGNVPELLTDEERLNRAVRSVRTYLRDKKEINRLLGGEFETTDEELKQAIMHALMDWNLSPPVLAAVSLATHPAKQLLVQLAAVHALQSSALWHSREHMPSSDGGTSADDHAKASEYGAWIDRMSQEYERKKNDIKTAQNITDALGGMSMPSEYSAYYYVFGQWW
jgi:hypothetical protein